MATSQVNSGGPFAWERKPFPHNGDFISPGLYVFHLSASSSLRKQNPATFLEDVTSVPGPHDSTSNHSSSSWSPVWAASVMPTPPDSPTPSGLHKSLVTSVTTKLGLRNLLKVPTSNADSYFFTRQCAYIFYCSRLKVPCSYPELTNQSVLEDERVKEAVEMVATEELQDSSLELGANGQLYLRLLSGYTKQACATLSNMKAALSSTLIRITGYVLFKVFNYLFMSVTVTEGQLQMIECAANRNVPLIFVPLHRSHVDYLFVTWVLFNRQIAAPIVAAGDNLRIPVFGWTLRGLGGFFIKRKLEANKTRKDFVYRAVLQTYVTKALHAGYNLEFFIEGGRTRTGKPCLPKGGLLSVVVDAFLNGTLDDALIVPIAINYDKILDGNFVKEQLGQTKAPETFWRAVRAIAKVLSTNYGYSRIDFSQPFSLKEFFHSSKAFLPSGTNKAALTPPSYSPSESPNPFSSTATAVNRLHSVSNSSSHTKYCPEAGANGRLHAVRSNSSLFGSEQTEEYRIFVKTLASHIVNNAEKCQAIMSTNAVSYLLSFVHRHGTTLDRLAASVERLQEDLRMRGRDTGFSGDPLSVAVHAVKMLSQTLVRVEGDPVVDDPTSVVVRPVTALPNVLELNYYANALAPVFALDAIVATSLLTMADCDLWSYKDVTTECVISQSKLVERSMRLCEILQNEFVFVAPCATLDVKISECVQALVINGLLSESTEMKKQTRKNYGSGDFSDDDSDDVATSFTPALFHIHPTSSNLEKVAMVTKSLSPLIEAYYATTLNLNSLVGRPTVDREFVNDTQTLVAALLKKGTLLYGESIAADPIRNAVKLMEAERVVESYLQDNVKVIFLNKKFESEERLWPVQEAVGSFRL